MNIDTTGLFQFTHLAVVVRDLDAALEHYGAMGFGPFKRFSLPSAEYSFSSREQFGNASADSRYECAYGRMGPVGLEVFQPISGDSIAQRFLDTKGEGIWHFGFDVADMDQAIEMMAERGHRVIGSAEYVDGTRMCYFDTAEPGGVVFQAHWPQSKGERHK